MDEPIIRWDREHIPGTRARFLDEFIADNVDIHYEAMGNVQFWLLVTCRETGRQWHLNFGAVNGRATGYAHVEEDRAL